MPTEAATPPTLSDLFAIELVVVGIFVSILLPVAIGTLNKARGGLESADGPPTFWDRLRSALGYYLGRGMVAASYVLAAVFVACVIVYFFDLRFFKPRDALLAGFAWESFVNKLTRGARE